MQQCVVLGSSSAWVLGYNNVFGIQQFFCLFFGIEQVLFYGIQQSVPVFFGYSSEYFLGYITVFLGSSPVYVPSQSQI